MFVLLLSVSQSALSYFMRGGGGAGQDQPPSPTRAPLFARASEHHHRGGARRSVSTQHRRMSATLPGSTPISFRGRGFWSQLLFDWSKTNVQDIVRAAHPNVATLFGACELSPGVRVLIYEYSCFGSLFRLLEGDVVADLALPEKARIAEDVAGGCAYLHSLHPPVVIGLTAHSVMLGVNFAAKIRIDVRHTVAPILRDNLW